MAHRESNALARMTAKSKALLVLVLLVLGSTMITSTNSKMADLPRTVGVKAALAQMSNSNASFTISARPNSATVPPGGSHVWNITLDSLNGFAGSVNVTLTYDSQHLTLAPEKLRETLVAGSSSRFIVSASTTVGTPLGSYPIILAATNGTIKRSTTLTLRVADLPVIISVSQITTDTNASTTIVGQGFGDMPPKKSLNVDGSVDTLEDRVTPSLAVWDGCADMNCSSGWSWQAGHNGNTIGVFVGNWSDTEIVLRGFGSHSLGPGQRTSQGCKGSKAWAICAGDTITIGVWGPNSTGRTLYSQIAIPPFSGPDFHLTASPTMLAITPSTSASSKVTVSSVNKFAGTVQLSASYTQSQLVVRGLPARVKLSAGGPGMTNSSTITVSFRSGSNVNPDIYTVNIIATNGTTTRSVQLVVDLSNPRETLAGVKCSPQSVAESSTTACTATVISISGTGAPAGNATFSSTGLGSFTPTSGVCSLHAVAPNIETCKVNYSPSGTAGTNQTIAVAYSGDSAHDSSLGTSVISILARRSSSLLMLSCTPDSLPVGSESQCVAIVEGSLPSGTVAFFLGAGDGFLLPGSCVLVSGMCSTSVRVVSPGIVTLEAQYSGDSGNNPTAGSAQLIVEMPVNAAGFDSVTLMVANGAFVSDQTSATRVSVTVTGSTAVDGTRVAVVTQRLTGVKNSVGTLNLNDVSYYDVLVAGITDGSAVVCITSQTVDSSTSMVYWSGSAWYAATNVGVNGQRVCGTIPVSELAGTVLAIGNSSSQSSSPFLSPILAFGLALAVGGFAGLLLARSWSKRRGSRYPLQMDFVG